MKKHIGSMYSINDKCIEFPGVLKLLAGSLLRLHERIVLDTVAGHANKRNDTLYTQSMAYSENYSHRRHRLTIDVCSYVHRSVSLFRNIPNKTCTPSAEGLLLEND